MPKGDGKRKAFYVDLIVKFTVDMIQKCSCPLVLDFEKVVLEACDRGSVIRTQGPDGTTVEHAVYTPSPGMEPEELASKWMPAVIEELQEYGLEALPMKPVVVRNIGHAREAILLGTGVPTTTQYLQMAKRLSKREKDTCLVVVPNGCHDHPLVIGWRDDMELRREAVKLRGIEQDNGMLVRGSVTVLGMAGGNNEEKDRLTDGGE